MAAEQCEWRKQTTRVLYTLWVEENSLMEWPPTSLPAGLVYVNGQRERCGTTGKIHWQGYMESVKTQRFQWFRDLMFKSGTHSSHANNKTWLVQVKKNNGASKYGLKEETYLNDDSRFEFGTRPTIATSRKADKMITSDMHDKIMACKSWAQVLKIDRIHTVVTWAKEVWHSRPEETDDDTYKSVFQWQRKVIDRMMEVKPHDREILFVIDPIGGKGKSELARILQERTNCFVTTNQPKRDMADAFRSHCGSQRDPKVVVIDIPRDVEAKRWPWAFMEELKNGMMTCSKYQSGIMKFKRPNVVLFANYLPNIADHLSVDRIKVMMLSPHNERCIAHLQAQGGEDSVQVSNISKEKPWPDWGAWARELVLEPTRDDQTLTDIPIPMPVSGGAEADPEPNDGDDSETDDPPHWTSPQEDDEECMAAIEAFLQEEEANKKRKTMEFSDD